MKRQFPKLWPEWEDLIDNLARAGIDTDAQPELPIHLNGVGFWLDRLAQTPVSHEQVTIIDGIVTDVIEAVKSKYEGDRE